ncbi:hypothetical protein CEXT_287281 [Caerostris extrusa]|uniref:Uncharacterized protein n=1 Tax=Caerostris extrusa TaxID=172846 RepID=A0AAV4XMA0_CAEEX|nr:hypothetical protein CEXT_287281 [Caerostris extrusa]
MKEELPVGAKFPVSYLTSMKAFIVTFCFGSFLSQTRYRTRAISEWPQVWQGAKVSPQLFNRRENINGKLCGGKVGRGIIGNEPLRRIPNPKHKPHRIRSQSKGKMVEIHSGKIVHRAVKEREREKQSKQFLPSKWKEKYSTASPYSRGNASQPEMNFGWGCCAFCAPVPCCNENGGPSAYI